MANVAAVQWDQEKPKARQREQEEQFREYVAHHLYPYSPFYRRRFDTAGIAPRNITGFDDLAKLEPTRWSDVTSEPVAFVRPFDQARNIGEDEFTAIAGSNTKLRMQGGERVIRDLGLCRADGRQKRRFPSIGQADNPGVGDELQA